MKSSNHIVASCLRLGVGTLILALCLQTWLVMGLIEPVYVAGSSMAPTFRGPHRVAHCSDCDGTAYLAAEGLPNSHLFRCPHCGQSTLNLDRRVARGGRLWIDRTAFVTKAPKRWQTAVLVGPDSGRLCIKRIAGLPGETVELVDGDVFVDGARIVKSLDEQRAVRQSVPGQWRYNHDGSMAYHSANGRPVTDALSDNAGLSLMLNPTFDLMLSVEIYLEADGRLGIEVDRGAQKLNVNLEGATIEVVVNQLRLSETHISPRSVDRLRRGRVSLEVSTFDEQLLLAIDGTVELQQPLAPARGTSGTVRPFAITVNRGEVSPDDAEVWRDIYYSKIPAGFAPRERAASTRLAAGEIFLLGDNPAVSVDSRVWGPAPVRLLLGRPVGVR